MKKSFTLKSLLVVLTVLAILCAWLAEGAKTQRVAVIRIRNAGGTCIYDLDQDVGERHRRNQWEPNWLREFVGRDFFDSVVGAWIDNDGERSDIDQFAENLLLLDAVEHVHINDCNFTPKSGIYFGKMQRLESLQFASCEIDAGFWPAFSANRSIRWLSVSPLSVPDDALDSIVKLRTLRRLHIVQSEIDENAMYPDSWSRLRLLDKLEELSLARCRLSNTALSSFAELPELSSLAIIECRMVEEFDDWDKFPKLRQLRICNSNVGEASLESLRHANSLVELELTGTNISPQAIGALKAALVNCKITVH